MSELNISLLGNIQVTLNNTLVTEFESDKVRALLAYLVVEASRPHRRGVLAALLWPEMADSKARSNLRHILANLRRTIQDYDTTPPFLLITRQTLQFNKKSSHALDIADFKNCLIAIPPNNYPTLQKLKEAVGLYKGDFLYGFSITCSTAFEAWTLLIRERLRKQMVGVINQLADTYARRGQYEKALHFAYRWVEMEPWDEAGHQQLIRLLALNGQRCAALTQYKRCCRLLADELGVMPTATTTTLYQRILADQSEGELSVKVGRLRGFELCKKIGEGVFGAVYQAYQPIIGRDVAIKIISPQFANDPNFTRRFEAEAQIVALLEHPHIVPLYDYWREPDGLYLVMRWLRGGNLTNLVAQGPCTVETAVNILDQITFALDTAHQKGIIHCDLKPTNILFDEYGNAYLTDFCVVNGYLHSTSEIPQSVVMNRSNYISPEQACGQSIMQATDLYSMGIILYEMLTGQHPFLDMSPNLPLPKRLNKALPSLCQQRPDLPKSVDDVIQQATAKQPSARFTTAPALAAAFRAALGLHFFRS